MKGKSLILIPILATMVVLAPAEAFGAAIPTVYTKDSFITGYHDRPLSFSEDKYGNFSGVTESGKTFTQTYVTSTISVRLQKFSVDKIEFYISDRGIIKAENDIEALSIYLVAVGWS